LQITLVGKIASIQDSATVVVLTLDDGTGRCPVKFFPGSEEDEYEKQKRAEWRIGAYVRVHGHLGNMGTSQAVIAFAIRPIAEHNEVTFHFLQAIFQRAHLAQGAANSPAAPAQTAGLGGYGVPAAAYVPAGGGAAGNAVFQEVQNIFQEEPSEVGLTAEQVMSRTGGRLSAAAVQAAIRHLVDEGTLYSTIDEHHWKAC
jgi:replication factor A2